jgi:hypothetical protein
MHRRAAASAYASGTEVDVTSQSRVLRETEDIALKTDRPVACNEHIESCRAVIDLAVRRMPLG